MAEDLPKVDSRARKGGRWLRRCLVLLVVLQVTYCLAANWALRSSWVQELIQQRSRRAQITWTSASTWWPGRVHVEDFKLWQSNAKTTWRIDVDDGTLRIGLLPLLQRQLHLQDIRGRSYGFWLRRETASGLLATAQPELPPLFEPPSPTVAPAAKRQGRSPWRFEISGAALRQPRELWVGAYRLRGDIEIEGGLSYLIGGDLEIEPSRLVVKDGLFELADHPLANDLSLTLDIAFSPFSPRQHRGTESLSFASGRLEVDAQISGLRLLNQYLAAYPWLRVESSGGHLQGGVGFAAGFVTDGSRLRVDDAPVALSFYGGQARGQAQILAEVLPRQDKLEYRLEVRLQDAEAGSAEDGTIIAQVPSLRFVASDEAFHLVRGFKDPALEIDLPQARFPDLRFVETHLPPSAGLRIRRGQGDVALHIDADADTLHGRLRVVGTGLDLDYRDRRVAASATFDAELIGGDLQAGRFSLKDARLQLESPTGWSDESSAGPGKPWRGRLQLESGSLQVIEPWHLEGKLEMQLTDSAPIFVLFLSDHRLLKHFRKALTVRDVHGTTDLRLGRRRLALRDIDLDCQELQALGQLDLTAAPPDGLLWVRFHGATAALEIEAGKRDLKLIRPRRWYDEKSPGWWKKRARP